MMRGLAVVVGPAFVLTGCATTGKYEKVLDSWLGSHADDLVRSWGAPASVYQMGDGGRVLLYDSRSQGAITTPVQVHQAPGSFIGGMYFRGQTTVTGGQVIPLNLWCKTQFATDGAGVIRRWRWEGNSCKAR